MATTTLPVQVSVSITGEVDPGVEAAARVVELLLSAKPYTHFRFDLSGSGSKAIDVPNNPQLILVIYEQGTAAIELDLGTDVITLKQGGIFLVGNPSAATNLPLTVNHTAAAVVRGIVYG